MEPLITICIRSFNQEHYIVKALDSALSQQSSFPFVIIVGDDCSTDNTRKILLSYQHKYPNIIKLLLGTYNIGGPNNLRRVIETATTKYLAFLDGDDYFTDVYKIQKQVSFLESHPDYAACFHNVVNIYEGQGNPPSLFLPLDFPEYHDCISIISKDWFLPIHSVVLRREFVSFPEWYDKVMNDDYVVNLSVAMHGPYHYLPDIMAVYRHHENNISKAYYDLVLTDTQLRNILIGFREIYPESYRSIFDQKIAFYNKEIAFNKREIEQPWRKYFRLKTYKRFLKKKLRLLF